MSISQSFSQSPRQSNLDGIWSSAWSNSIEVSNSWVQTIFYSLIQIANINLRLLIVPGSKNMAWTTLRATENNEIRSFRCAWCVLVEVTDAFELPTALDSIHNPWSEKKLFNKYLYVQPLISQSCATLKCFFFSRQYCGLLLHGVWDSFADSPYGRFLSLFIIPEVRFSAIKLQ